MEGTAIMQCPVCKTRHVPRQDQEKAGVFAANCENCGHFFKYRTVAPFKTSVTFTVNGVSYTAGQEYGASTSLNDFLRQSRASMGTKVMCKQGGCGICIVEAKMQLSPSQPKVSATVNSCLCPLFLCDGWEITTVEGLGSTRNGMHKIQENLSTFGGTQCGYCSTGHVMNMYGLMEKYPNLTKQFVEDHFEGNLCRCTGYRPILDAFKALVPDTTTDIEDLSRKMCINTPGKLCKSNGQCSSHCHSETKAIRMAFDNVQWFKAVDYADLLKMLQTYNGQRVKLLGANTGTGYYPSEGADNFDVIIDISGVPEFHLNSYDSTTRTYTVGASVTLSDLIELFTKEAAKAGNTGGFNELKKYMYRVASFPIRNRGTWAGNLMLKNHHNDFPSDVFNIMTVLKASLYTGPTTQDILTPDAFFKTNMSGRALSKATFGDIPATDIVACFKVMPRSQNALALVNGAFRCTVDVQNNFTIMGQPIISIGGISGSFHRASKTEAYLVGKQISAQQTVIGAMGVLATELVPSNDITLSSPVYRKLVACALLYKYFLYVLGNSVGSRYRSGPTVLHDVRALSSGTQSYDTNKLEWPVNQPVKKLEADIQCTGEAEYTDDIAPLPGQLYASFVKSTQANATIQNINTSDAMGLPGVVKVITASDIPSGGKNNISGFNLAGGLQQPEEALCSGTVLFHGQPVAVVVADTQELADKAAAMVKVTYTNIQKAILTVDEAIQQQSIIPLPNLKDLVVGDPDEAIAMSSNVTSGQFYLQNQYHMHMETQSSIAIPTDEGLEIKTTTQWMDSVQMAVAQVCGIPKSKVSVEVKRVGGAYGGKITRNNILASVCGLAAYLTNRPVRMRMTLQTNMEMVGKRFNFKADYQVGHDANGKINGIIVTYFGDQGCNANDSSLPSLMAYCDNAYFCPSWKVKVVALKTNKPLNTFCRAPGSVPGIFIMEQMMEHVARKLNKDPLEIKSLNLYKQGQRTPVYMTLNHCNLQPVMDELMSSAQVTLRQKTLDYFNRDNRWKKKALSIVPIKWGIGVSWTQYSVLVNINAGDGSVLVTHGGIEMGQGINTKVAQVVAYELGIPLSMVTVKGANSTVAGNNTPTGGSVSSECCCQGAVTCCTNLVQRMAPVKAKMTNPTWKDLVNKCFSQRVNLTEKVYNTPTETPPFEYNSYGASCTEVELDVLTGEYQINRADMVFDCGESLNPAVDIGQVEGSFIMGLGYCTSEDLIHDPTTGRLLNNDTWTYHPPTNKDIPTDFRISLLKNAPNPAGVLRSKASGEPPLCMSFSVFFALRKCIEEARKEVGNTSYFNFNPPATVEKVQQLCLVDPSQFQLQ